MSLTKRILKRFRREHRVKLPDGVRIVDRPATEEEGRRRADKAMSLVGTPFKHLPGNPDKDQVLFIITEGVPAPEPVTVEIVEMVYNDAWLIDQCSGPGSYRSHCKSLTRIVYDYAISAYESSTAVQEEAK